MTIQRNFPTASAAQASGILPASPSFRRILAAFEAVADHAAIAVVVVALPVLLGALALHTA